MRHSQAKPKFYLRAETCTKRRSMSFRLLAIPAFDRIAGRQDRNLHSLTGYMLLLTEWCQAEGLD